MFPEIHPSLTTLLSAGIAFVLFAAPVAFVYTLWVWQRSSSPRPLLFNALVFCLGLLTVGGVYLGAIGFIRMTERHVPAWALPEFSAVAAIALLAPVIVLALVIRRLRS